jgi:hypothetical protein
MLGNAASSSDGTNKNEKFGASSSSSNVSPMRLSRKKEPLRRKETLSSVSSAVKENF